MRFSTSFRSSNRPFKCNRVTSSSLIGRALEGASLVGEITIRFSRVG
jgi:hypothetical protein